MVTSVIGGELLVEATRIGTYPRVKHKRIRGGCETCWDKHLSEIETWPYMRGVGDKLAQVVEIGT